jgi:phage gpG-like protein
VVAERSINIVTQAKNIMADSTSFGFSAILSAFKVLQPKLPKELANIAQKFFISSFDKQGFTDTGFTPWKEVQRREGATTSNKKAFVYAAKGAKFKEGFGYTQGSKASRTNPILQGNGSGILRHSIHVLKAGWQGTQITVEVGTTGRANAYADVHNDGLKSGRGSGFTMPKREFIGDSEKLNTLLEAEITREIDQIFK